MADEEGPRKSQNRESRKGGRELQNRRGGFGFNDRPGTRAEDGARRRRNCILLIATELFTATIPLEPSLSLPKQEHGKFFFSSLNFSSYPSFEMGLLGFHLVQFSC